MKVKQISVFLENKSGRLAAVTRVLGEEDINIRALSIADTSDFGILRLIVNQPEKAYRALKDHGFTVSMTDVIAVEMPDQPGGLAEVMAVMEEHNLNIEYLYAFIGKVPNGALVIFRVENIDEALKILEEKGITVLSGEKVYSL
ncbi:ACT domain-containing protein [Calderihabitans maritimus]|uniref:Amino acid-binding ACT domain-containing protein n=1 Tax=Calderihabitans maritimus TaxID=1246530 RepID=A0A1Z5HPN8_9FIRM|nr:ACT domain-containing protein [Calderihabitans maritimus]GAW91265.1 amino acid-binding ACT domain-containing protein [Calderihabitans maritimus]